MCSARPIRADELDALVWDHVSALLADPALIRAELERRLAELRGADRTVAQRGRLELELQRVRSAASRLVTAFGEDLLSLDELRARMPDLRSREASLRAQLDALDAQLLDRASYLALAETLETFLARLREAAANASIEARQRILRLVVRDVLVGPNESVIRHSIPTSLRPDHATDHVLRERRQQPLARQHLSPPVSPPARPSLAGPRQGMLARYADDAVILCRTQGEAEAALDLAWEILAGLGLELHPDKTRIVDLREGRQGFDFLGCHFPCPGIGPAVGAWRPPLLPPALAVGPEHLLPHRQRRRQVPPDRPLRRGPAAPLPREASGPEPATGPGPWVDRELVQ
ncbi:MAG: hypothetical protein C0498_03155 [Anaerolinea sp.]|nr:hypothetical protein [Anaerolinea sp.]